jgi:hypothetical protein
MKFPQRDIMILSVVALLIGTSVVLPTSRIYGFNYKIVLILLSLFVFAAHDSKNCLHKANYIQLMAFCTFVAFYILISQINGVPFRDSQSESEAFFSAFSIFWILLLFLNKKIIKPKLILYIIIYSAGAVSLIKIIAFSGLMAGYSLHAMQLQSYEIFGNHFIGMKVGNLYRISFGSDNLLPAVLFTVLAAKNFQFKFKPFIKFILVIITTISIAISYSRYLWFEASCSIVLQSIYFKKTRDYSKHAILLVLAILASIFIFYNLNFILVRYNGDNAEISDLTRFEMLHALAQQIYSSPIFGGGMGATTPGFTNIPAIPWYYELQWLAFIMQFGFIGFTVLFFSALSLIVREFYLAINFNLIALACMYLLWVATGIFNGFMLTSIGGIIFMYFYIIIRINREMIINGAN